MKRSKGRSTLYEQNWFEDHSMYLAKILLFCIKKQLLMLLVLMTLIGYAHGVESTLYEIELPIAAEGSFEQSKHLKQAFQDVLVRLSGSDKALNNEGVIKALAKPDTYVKQFSYHQRSNAERFVKVVFNQAMVKELLNAAKQSIWEKKRPLTVVWLMINRDQTLQWVGNDSEEQLGLVLEKELKRRGIPLVFPMLDLTDTAELSEKDIWDGALEPLQQRTKRYNGDTILVGRLNQTPEGWQSRWTLFLNESKINWDITKPELNMALTEVAENLTTSLSGFHVAETAQVLPKTSHLLVSVAGILSAEQYNKVLDYLQRLPSVSTVEVAQIMPEKTIFSLQISHDKETLVKAIAEGQLLQETPSTEHASQTLTYKMAGVSI